MRVTFVFSRLNLELPPSFARLVSRVRFSIERALERNSLVSRIESNGKNATTDHLMLFENREKNRDCYHLSLSFFFKKIYRAAKGWRDKIERDLSFAANSTLTIITEREG